MSGNSTATKGAGPASRRQPLPALIGSASISVGVAGGRCAAHHVLYAICAVTLVVIAGSTGHGTIYGREVWGVAGELRSRDRRAGAAAANAGRGVWATVRLLTPSATGRRTRRWPPPPHPRGPP